MAIVLIRAVILYIVITFSLRLMGKRQLGELQPSELVVTILISNIAAIPVEDSSVPMIMGIVPILTLVCLDVVMSGIMLKSTKIRKLIIGSPRIIISEGKILQNEMKRLRFSVDDIMESMRTQNIFDIKQIHYAIVETNGKINFLLKKDYQPAEKQDVKAGGSTENPPSVIIRDGVRDSEQLRLIDLGEAWLTKILRENHLSEKQVFLMTADKNGNYEIVESEKKK